MTNDEAKIVARQLVGITAQINAFKREASRLEGLLLIKSEEHFDSTKSKTVRYGDGLLGVTVQKATKVTVLYPSLLKAIFGDAYDDSVTVKHKTEYSLSKPAERLLAGMYLSSYTETTVDDVLRQACPDNDKRGALAKKVKGINFTTDKKYLMQLAGLDERAAEEYAYFASEAAVWQDFERLIEASNLPDEVRENVLKTINTAIIAEEIPRITVETGE